MSHRLGAIELIELGAPRRVPTTRRPFLSNRMSGPRLGIDFLADIGSFLTGTFEFLFKTLASVVNVPLDLASQGTGLLFDGLAGLLVNVPILGVLASQVLLLTKSIIQWGLSVPGLLLGGLGNIFGDIKKAIDSTKTPDQKKSDEQQAKDKILESAQKKGGDPLKNAVSQALAGQAPSGATNVPPQQPIPAGAEGLGISGPDLNQILGIGLPVAGGLALVFALLT